MKEGTCSHPLFGWVMGAVKVRGVNLGVGGGDPFGTVVVVDNQ